MFRPGPLGRGGARRRTRRRWRRRTALLMMTTSQKQQIQQQTGKNPETMTEDELNAAMTKTGIQPVDATDQQIADIEKFADLKEKGVLSEKEFEEKKAQILGIAPPKHKIL
ncbi:MAG: SHOCT domain-containing protein [Candidatus Bathyarchaeia archaeon]